jgi:hypothetical protein
MKRSENINELAASLSKAQAEIHNPAFDSKNPHFKSSYASLAAVRNAVVPVLAKHGLSVLQDVISGLEGITCVNLLTHSSGQWIETEGITVPTDKQNAHGFGSASTYARRFSLMALACVVGDDDDDGNASVAAPAPKREVVDKDTGEVKPEPKSPKQQLEEAKTLEDLQSLFKKFWAGADKKMQGQLKTTYDKCKAALTKPDEEDVL